MKTLERTSRTMVIIPDPIFGYQGAITSVSYDVISGSAGKAAAHCAAGGSMGRDGSQILSGLRRISEIRAMDITAAPPGWQKGHRHARAILQMFEGRGRYGGARVRPDVGADRSRLPRPDGTIRSARGQSLGSDHRKHVIAPRRKVGSTS